MKGLVPTRGLGFGGWAWAAIKKATSKCLAVNKIDEAPFLFTLPT